MGVLSALPIISMGNVCCCLWVVSGGVIAAYLFQQNTSRPVTPADGAIVGLLAGLAGAVVQLIVSIPVDILIAPMTHAIVQRALEMGTLPPEIHDALARYGSSGAAMTGAFLIIRSFLQLTFFACIGGVFSTLGGLIGALIFKKQTPAGVIDVPPQS